MELDVGSPFVVVSDTASGVDVITNLTPDEISEMLFLLEAAKKIILESELKHPCLINRIKDL